MDGAASAGTPAPSLPRGRFFRVALAAAALAMVPSAAAPAASPSRATALVRAGGSADRAAVEAARRFLCPHGGAPARGGRCRAGHATFAAATAAGRDPSVRDWDAGLPAAARRQAPCPEGTVQARPLFWNDAVRCMPR